MARHRVTPDHRRRMPFARIGAAALIVLVPCAVPASADPWPENSDHAIAMVAAALDAAVTPSSPPARIKGLQHLLTHHGIATDADGVYGPGTTASVRTFQERSGLAVDGEAGPDTLGALVVRTEQGQSGNNVRAVQALLVGAGSSVGVDGEFGAGTAEAVRGFQSANGLGADGIVGPLTWTALFNAGSGGGGGNCDGVSGGVPIEQTAVATNNIRVHTCFLDRTNAMIAAAAADGVTLTANSAWRSRDEQIALRRQNCGPTDYDIYEKPSDQCNPHTAKPGQSNHETGLAVDFANAGTGGAVNNWLHANAAAYHYYNYPPEPWHWSWSGG